MWVGAEEDNQQSQYRQIFNSKVTGLQVWRAVQIVREVERVLAAERGKRHGRDRQIGVHGNRLIAHQVFQQLPPRALSDPGVDFDSVLKTVPRLVRRVYSATISVVRRDYAGNYIASLFKNATRCRDVTAKAHTAERLRQEQRHEAASGPSEDQDPLIRPGSRRPGFTPAARGRSRQQPATPVPGMGGVGRTSSRRPTPLAALPPDRHVTAVGIRDRDPGVALAIPIAVPTPPVLVVPTVS